MSTLFKNIHINNHMRSHKNLGPIGSVVLTFISYKQTDKQAKYMFILMKEIKL